MEINRLREVQLQQLKIMDSIHSLCEENRLTYYIIGGTALGAVRHGGFIPWDFDIDIAMPRKDYDRFVDEVSGALPTQFSCHSWKNEENYYPPHALVTLNGSGLTQKNDYLNPKLKRYGIFVDIFPLDQSPDEEELRKDQARDLRRLSRMKTRKFAISYKENSQVKLLAKKALSLCYALISVKKINEKQEVCMKRYAALPETKNWCSMASHYSYAKQCMPKEIYGTPQLIPFEERHYYAPEQLDEYLKRIFGDYMKLPSPEKQKEQRDYFINASWSEEEN